jgi:hypothetical protein
LLPDAHGNDHRLVILLAADAVNARDAGDDNHVAPRKQRTHGGEAQALDLLVAAGILFDERVGARDVGLRLVIIEVADEVFDGVVRKKTFELGVKLRGERFVVRNDERGLVHVPMTLATVNVLPEPVTPSSVWCFAPDKMPSVSFAIACGWSPAGW